MHQAVRSANDSVVRLQVQFTHPLLPLIRSRLQGKGMAAVEAAGRARRIAFFSFKQSSALHYARRSSQEAMTIEKQPPRGLEPLT